MWKAPLKFVQQFRRSSTKKQTNRSDRQTHRQLGQHGIFGPERSSFAFLVLATRDFLRRVLFANVLVILWHLAFLIHSRIGGLGGTPISLFNTPSVHYRQLLQIPPKHELLGSEGTEECFTQSERRKMTVFKPIFYLAQAS